MDETVNRVVAAQEQLRESLQFETRPPPPALRSDFDAKGPGPGTWIVAGFGLVLVWPGVIALIFAMISRSKALAARKVMDLGDAVEATKLASTASTLRIVAVLLSVVPLGLLVLAVFAVTMLGQEAADSFSIVE